MTDNIDIHLISDRETYDVVEEISKAAWHLDNYREVIPSHLMITFQQNGGLVLGAYLIEELVGFSLSFIGLTDDGRVKLCSEQLGVLPQYQNHNIGYRLKLAQRQEMMARGINHITWTFDPLETKNGKLNLNKLGAVSNTYLLNVYGKIAGINAGIPTDRFQVDWWLDTPHVTTRLQSGSTNKLNDLLANGATILNPIIEADNPAPSQQKTPIEGSQLLLQVPANFQRLKQNNLELGKTWRQHTRDLFTAVFQQGYLTTDLLFAGTTCYYLLEKGVTP